MEIAISVILLILCICVLVAIHVCVVSRVFGEIHQSHGAGTIGMSHGDLKKLPCFDYAAEDKGNSTVDCAVCLENFNTGDKCRLLPNCGHSFHAQCIDLWLLRTPICPICRKCANSRKIKGVSGEGNGIPMFAMV